MAAAHARRLVLVVAADIVRLVMERPGQKRPDRVVRAAKVIVGKAPEEEA